MALYIVQYNPRFTRLLYMTACVHRVIRARQSICTGDMEYCMLRHIRREITLERDSHIQLSVDRIRHRGHFRPHFIHKNI